MEHENPRTVWLVEVDVMKPDPRVGWTPKRQTVIAESYDGTAVGARHWVYDVLDYADVRIRSTRPVYGELVESRSTGRLDEVSS